MYSVYASSRGRLSSHMLNTTRFFTVPSCARLGITKAYNTFNLSKRSFSTPTQTSTTLATFTPEKITSGLQLTINQIWETRMRNPQSYKESDIITIQGWVRSVRSQKDVVFIMLNDGSNVAGFQTVFEEFDKCSLDVIEQAKKVSLGSSLSVTGQLVRNLRNAEDAPDAYEIRVHTFKVLGDCSTGMDANDQSSKAPMSEIEIRRAAKKAAKEQSRLASAKAKTATIPLDQLSPDNFPIDVPEVLSQAASIQAVPKSNEPVLTPYPLQKKYMSLAYLREFPHLRCRTNTYASILRIRSAATHALHDFFRLGSYLSVHTPVITPLDCEGAGEMFHVSASTDSKPVDDPEFASSTCSSIKSQDGASKESLFFNNPSFLSVSGQLYAEIASSSHPRVYSFGPTFRAENSHTTRHLAEFWMLEPEIAFAENHAVMKQCELSVKYAIAYLMERHFQDISFLSTRQSTAKDEVDSSLQHRSTLIEKLTKTRDVDFAKITYTDAIARLLKDESEGKISFVYPLSWGVSLQSEHERYLAEVIFERPVFITNYPASIKPFYMFMNPTKEELDVALTASGSNDFHGIDANILSLSESEERRTVACFDLIVPGVGELCGGSQREHRYEVLLQRMKNQGLDLKPYQWYLDLRRFGTVPHGGWGMGFERFLAFASGVENVRDTTLVPRAPNLMQM